MTIAELDERIAYIRAIRGDDEAAHNAEDKLHRDVLEATCQIEFCRWYA